MSRMTTLAGLVVLLAFCQPANAQDIYSSVGYPSDYEPLFPFDSPEPWMHGYFQRVPYYGGFRSFRPYNYKHVLSQTQTSAGWGINPRMPYSQQFWHKYHRDATMAPYEAEIRPDLSSNNVVPATPAQQPNPYGFPPTEQQPAANNQVPAQSVSAPASQQPILLIPGN